MKNNTLETSTLPPSETVTFLTGASEEKNKVWSAAIKENIVKLPNAEDFRNAYIIAVENDADNHNLQDCYGVKLALDILRHSPKAKVLLFGFVDEAFIHMKRPEFSLVLNCENAHFLRYPFEKIEMFNNIFYAPNRRKQLGGYTVSQEAQKYLSTIFHDIKYVKDWDNPSDEDKPRFDAVMKKMKNYFPIFVDSSPEEIISFLKSVSVEREEVMKGKRLSGVYCDIEGTLLVDGRLNEKVVSALKAYKAKRKKITIWTDGDVEELGAQLKALGISYPLKSKFDCAGAVAEVIIDDQDEYTFAAATKISAERFIKVSDL